MKTYKVLFVSRLEQRSLAWHPSRQAVTTPPSPPPPHMCSECHMIRVKCTKSLLFAETLHLRYVNSSVCPGHQPPDAKLCHPDVAACALELVLRRHGGVLRSLLQAGSGGHAGRQHLCAARYNTTTHTSADVGIS